METVGFKNTDFILAHFKFSAYADSSMPLDFIAQLNSIQSVPALH